MARGSARSRSRSDRVCRKAAALFGPAPIGHVPDHRQHARGGALLVLQQTDRGLDDETRAIQPRVLVLAAPETVRSPFRRTRRARRLESAKR